MKMNKLVSSVLKIFLSALLIFSFGISALNTAGYSEYTYLFAALALCLAGLFSFAFSKIPRFLSILGLGILVVGLSFLILYNFDLILFFNQSREFIIWLSTYLSGNVNFNPEYGLLFGSLLFLLIALLISISEKWAWTQIALIIGGIIYFAYLWFSYIDFAKTGGLVFVSIALCRYCLILFEKKIANLRKSGYEIDGSIIKGVALTIAVTALVSYGISASIPLSIEPVYWEWLSYKTLDTFPFIVNFRNDYQESRDFGYNNSSENNGGIGNAKRFGESVKLSEKPVIEITTDYTKTLYLRGSVYDLYTADGWLSGIRNEQEYKSGDDIYGKTFLHGPERVEDIKLLIKHVGIISSSAFTPYRTNKIVVEKSKIYMDERNRIFFSRLVPKKDVYEVSAKIPFMVEKFDSKLLNPFKGGLATSGVDIFKEAKRLESFKNNLYYSKVKVATASGKEIKLDIKDDIIQSNIFFDEKNSINYFLIPNEIPDRVRELAFSIIADAKIPKIKENPFLSMQYSNPLPEQLLKVTAIAEYLRSNYEYTLTPPSRPAKSELTDYFLFESKKGYCVHFATAMTVLLRSVGIPARYVEGFVSEGTSDKTRIVKASKAHAWVEVYLQNLGGWYTFEPTPIISSAVPSQISAVNNVTPGSSGGVDKYAGTVVPGVTNKNPRPNRLDEEPSGIRNSPIVNKNMKIFLSILRAVSLVLLGLFVLFALYCIAINFVLPKYKIRNLKKYPEGKILDSFVGLLFYLGAFIGVLRRKDMTLAEFLEEAADNINSSDCIKDKKKLIIDLETAIRAHSRVRFGGYKLEENEVANFQDVLAALDHAGVCCLGKFENFKRKLQYKW